MAIFASIFVHFFALSAFSIAPLSFKRRLLYCLLMSMSAKGSGAQTKGTLKKITDNIKRQFSQTAFGSPIIYMFSTIHSSQFFYLLKHWPPFVAQINQYLSLDVTKCKKFIDSKSPIEMGFDERKFELRLLIVPWKVHKLENFFGSDFWFLSKLLIPMKKMMFLQKKFFDLTNI